MDAARTDDGATTGSSPLAPARLATYALPSLAVNFIGFGLLAVIPGFYATNTRVTLTMVGTVLFVGRLFNAFTDPLVGYLSDRTRTRFGPRKPWLVAGAGLASAAILLLFSPPASAGFLYFLLVYMALDVPWSMLFIPYTAWGSELSRDYAQRSRIFTYSGVASGLGTLMFAAAPWVIAGGRAGYGVSVMRAIGWVGSAALVVAVMLAVSRVPQGSFVRTAQPSLRDLWDSVRHNRPLWHFVAMYGLSGMSTGVFLSTLFLYVSDYLRIGDVYSLAFLCWGVAQLGGGPVWLRVIYRLGKHRTWALACGVSAILLPLLALVKPGPAAVVPVLVVSALRGFASATDVTVPSSLFGDVIDYDLWKTGVNRAGNYYAFLSLVTKGAAALGGSLAFFLLGAFGYKVNAANAASGQAGMLFTALIVPSLLLAASAGLLWRFPIDARRHAIILRSIERRSARTADRDAAPAADAGVLEAPCR